MIILQNGKTELVMVSLTVLLFYHFIVLFIIISNNLISNLSLSIILSFFGGAKSSIFTFVK